MLVILDNRINVYFRSFLNYSIVYKCALLLKLGKKLKYYKSIYYRINTFYHVAILFFH